ncbi:hypothetical protein OIV83_001143 [Microbotryomycetes sp. JL201]|nr:hypothetical protein OIV83_001143 [Microbotryomycetes sp. JL201]
MAPAVVNADSHVSSHSAPKSNVLAPHHTPPPSPPHDMYVEVEQAYTNTGQWSPARAATDSYGASGDGTGSLRTPLQFVAYNRTYPLRSEHEDFTWIEPLHPALLRLARSLYPTMSTLYDRVPGIDCRDLYVRRQEIRSQLELLTNLDDKSAIQTLLNYVESKFRWVAAQIAEYPPGMISWHLLWSLVTVGEDVESIHDISGEPMALVIDAWAYVQESMGRANIMHAGPSTDNVIADEADDSRTKRIARWFVLLIIALLLLTKMPTERGQRYIHVRARPLFGTAALTTVLQYTRTPHARYEGFFYTRAFAGASKTIGDGQVIMDVKSWRRMNPSLDSWGDDLENRPTSLYTSSSTTALSAPVDFDQEQAYLLPPILHGFSLRAKRWGEFLVDQLSTISWTDNAFEHLVIPSSYRRIIRSLVTVHAASDLKGRLMTDVVEGKGNGLIMALHGTPGTGKTLTAEAVAEHLQRPLYIVSAGELGITAQVLEKQLKDVLELATLWNAVLLIDEADIFLERRSTQQLERNALVGVFLRLLEYFSGVLILTTNSLERFDEAFLSRFAVVLRFDELDFDSRKTLWERFLSKASQDLSSFDLDKLASFKLNGRDIKHTVQTAQAVALCENETLTMSHFDEVLTVAKSTMSVTGREGPA